MPCPRCSDKPDTIVSLVNGEIVSKTRNCNLCYNRRVVEIGGGD